MELVRGRTLRDLLHRPRPADRRPRRSPSSSRCWPASPPPTGPASCTATSSPRTCSSASTAWSRSPTSGWPAPSSAPGRPARPAACSSAPSPTSPPSSSSAAAPTPAATSTPPASCSTRCSPATRRTAGTRRWRWPTSTCTTTCPPPSAEVPGLPWAVDELVARTTRRDPAGRPLDAGAFLAEMNQVRKGLGIEPVPVPTGRSTAGPDTLRPTNRPTRPRHPSDPMTEVLGRQIERHGAPGCCRGAPADDERQRHPPAPGRRRPGRPPARRPRSSGPVPACRRHIRRRPGPASGRWTHRAAAWPDHASGRRSAGGCGSGRWTTVPELVGRAGRRDRPAAGRGAGPRPATSSGARRSPPARSCPPTPAGEAIRGTDVRLVVSKGPERFRVDPALVGKAADAVGRSCRRPCRRPVHDDEATTTSRRAR